jgi:hypothetical protein
MAKELNLTDAQQQAMDQAREEMRAAMDKTRGNGSPSPDDFKKMQQLMEKQREKMDHILTAEQRQKMQKLMAKFGGGMGGPGGPPMGGFPGGPPLGGFMGGPNGAMAGSAAAHGNSGAQGVNGANN